MNNKVSIIIAFFIIFFLIFWLTSIFAVTNEIKWQMLKNFKESQYRLFFESEKPFLDQESKDIFNSSKKYRIYKSIKEKVKEKREFLETQNIKVINKIDNLETSVIILNNEIEDIKHEVLKINKSIIDLKGKIETKTQTIKILKSKIKSNKEILYKYIVHLYKKWNYVFNDWKIDNLKTIFFSIEDISTTINELHFNSLIKIAWRNIIDKHRKYINNLYIEQITLKSSESEIKSLRKQLIIKKALITQKKNFKDKLIKVNKGKQQLYQNKIETKKETEKRVQIKEFVANIGFKKWKKKLLEKLWCKFVDFWEIDPETVKLSERCMKLNKILYLESQIKVFDKDDAWNILQWPVKVTKWISAYYHDKWYMKMFWEDHDALDIPLKQGTKIMAPADWYVIHIEKPVKNWYSYLALKHSNWIITVYWHLSEILVNELDIVKKGEIFAKTWWIPWTEWAWILTTWAHLHFEVWEDKSLKDPLEYLNISELQIEEMPSIYFEKYKKDYKARTWKIFTWVLKSNIKSRTFKIKWDNEIERQKYFLNKYWVGSFRNWSLWVEAWLNASIDPTFLMCVWLAETWLWKHLKTAYNVWNVGNTDSGATRTFPSPRAWVAAMARTFNNRYLGQYNELKLLSRYWNLNLKKPIYASSPVNWHNNIVTCVSHIKWKFISNEYNFRLKK